MTKASCVGVVAAGLLLLVAVDGRLGSDAQAEQLQRLGRNSSSKLIRAATRPHAATLVLADASNFDSASTSFSGVAAGKADKSSGRVSVVTLADPSADARAGVAIVTSGLMNTGKADWENVTITATFNITKLATVGDKVRLSVAPMGGFKGIQFGLLGPPWEVSKAVSGPGVYKLTTPAFAMNPDWEYKATAGLRAEGALDQGIWAVGTITSIKFNL